MGPTGVGKTELAKALAKFLFGGRDREAGLHRHVLSDGRALLARVVVAHAETGVTRDDRHPADSSAAIVRVYDKARRQVRDPRTGVQVKNPETVLRDGRIDAFLLGAIGSRPNGAASVRNRAAATP